VSLHFNQLHQPLPCAHLGRARCGFATLVLPVGCRAFLCQHVHFLGTDLNFDRQIEGAVEHGMEGLVTVGFWQGYVVLETPGFGTVQAVDCTECQVTVWFGVSNDAESIDIVHFGKRQVLGQHFPVNAVRGFFSALDIAGNTCLVHFSFQRLVDIGNDLAAVTGDRADVLCNGAVPPGVQVGKTEIL